MDRETYKKTLIVSSAFYMAYLLFSLTLAYLPYEKHATIAAAKSLVYVKVPGHFILWFCNVRRHQTVSTGVGKWVGGLLVLVLSAFAWMDLVVGCLFVVHLKDTAPTDDGGGSGREIEVAKSVPGADL